MINHLLTTKQVAKILQIDVITLNTWRLQGKNLKFIKIGRSVRYREEDVNEYIQNSLRSSTNETGRGAV